MIEAIIFDCFGVLTADSWREYVESRRDEALKDELNNLDLAHNSGMLSEEDFIKQVSELTGETPEKIDGLVNRETTKNTPLLKYIGELRERGYKIGLLSNVANNWIRDYFLTEEEQELFDMMIFSFETGMTKPDRRIYMLACERLRVGPHEAIFIDDVERYIDAAEHEGLEGIVYKDFNQAKKEIEELLQGNTE